MKTYKIHWNELIVEGALIGIEVEKSFSVTSEKTARHYLVELLKKEHTSKIGIKEITITGIN